MINFTQFSYSFVAAVHKKHSDCHHRLEVHDGYTGQKVQNA